MMINYGGTYRPLGLAGHGSHISLDNLYVEITDDQGNVYVIDSSDDVGYYPYAAYDPEVVNNGATYLGGQGGIPNWDCNALGVSYNPWRFTEQMFTYSTFSSPTIGNTYGVSSGYPDEFGFMWSRGDSPEVLAGSTRPLLYWGYDDPFVGRIGPGAGALTNSGTYHDTPVGATGLQYTKPVRSGPLLHHCRTQHIT